MSKSQKVQLVFVKSYVENPTSNDTFSKTIEIDLPAGTDQAHLAGARCYQPDTSNSLPGGDINTSVLEYNDVNHLVGKLLTYIDATFVDPEQRKAQKDIVRGTVYQWHSDITTRAYQINDSQEKNR